MPVSMRATNPLAPLAIRAMAAMRQREAVIDRLKPSPARGIGCRQGAAGAPG